MATATVKAGQGAQLVQIDDLTGGVDLRRTPSLLKANRARTLRNWSLQEPGALTVYPGWVTFAADIGVTTHGAGRVYLANGTVCTLVAVTDTVYRLSDVGAWGSPLSDLDDRVSGPDVFFPFDRTIVAIMDGVEVPYKSTDATTWTQLGITAPPAAPGVAASAGTGLVDGSEYEVAFSYRDDALGHESNASEAASVTVSGANKQITVTMARSDDPQVDTIAVYARDVTAGETVLRRVDTVANPASGDATYVITSNSWSAGLEAPTDRDPAPVLDFAVVWKNRWWGKSATTGNRMYFTQVFEPQSWPALFYIDIPFGSGDDITALVPLGDTLVVFGSSGIYLVIGQTSLDFEVRPSAGAVAGALGPRAVCVLESGIIHASSSGVYLFDGASDRLLSWDIDPAWRTCIAGSAASDLDALAVVYHEPRKEVRIAVPNLAPTDTWGEWILDLSRTQAAESPAWTSTTRTIKGYLPWDGPEPTAANRGRLFSWVPASSQVCEEATGLSADGADLVAEYEGPALTMGLPMVRWIDLYGETKSAGGLYSLEVLVDQASVLSTTVGIGAGSDVYGTGTYGSAAYGGTGRRMFATNLPLTAEGRTLTLRTIYKGRDRFAHYTYAVGVVPEAVPRGIV